MRSYHPMLLSTSRGNLIEKILRNPDGRLVRATFCVYEYHGRAKARLVKVVFLDEAPVLGTQSFGLPGFVQVPAADFSEFVSTGPISSPYFNSNILYSLGTQPRAPTV